MKMSITRALVELKRLNDRIEQAILQGKFVSRTVGHNKFQKVVGIPNVSVEQAKNKIQASFDKVDALIINREKIKSAIVLSNASTYVSVLGRSMTVAEAIELKSTVTFRQQYLNTLRNQLMLETREVDKANLELDNAINTSLNTIYGNEKGKADPEMHKAITLPQKEQKEANLLDPMNIQSRIEKLSDEISQLSSEVDFVLSESNAMTQIDVELSE